MQLITILLTAVAILTFLTGLAVLCGATKRSRIQGIWFFFSTFGAALWSLAIAAFLTLPETSLDIAPALIIGIISGITLTDVALLGYTSWNSKTGKILTTLFAIGGAAIVALLATNPSLFYSHISFDTDFAILHVNHSWYFYLLIVYFLSISLVYSNYISQTIRRIRNHGAKNGLKIFQAGLSVGGILALVFDLILITSNPSMIWIGPMAVSVSIVAFYYSVVKYHILSLSGKWIEVLSYVILIALGIIGYILIFYLLFTALFHVPNPSPSILILNFTMAAVLLCAVPMLIEIISIIRSRLPSRQVDIGYVTKKLNRLRASNDVDLKELVGFLAPILKYEYLALQIGDKIYESAPNSRNHYEISQTLDLKDEKGKTYGHVLLGHPTTHSSAERWDVVQNEMIISLVGIIAAK